MSKIKVDQLETLDGSATVNVADLASAGSGVTDHGALTGLADDDHPQYHTDARGDARYSQLGHGHAISDVAGLQTALDGKQDTLVSGTNIKTINGNSLLGSGDITISSGGGGGGVTDHGALTGLADDDHPQYHTDARGDARYSQLGHGHAIADVTGLQTALDGKAASSHTHAIADVTGLQTALDGKAASSHTHTASQISDSTTVGRSVLTAADAAAARTAIGALPAASPESTGAIYDNGSVRSNIVDVASGTNFDLSLGNYFIRTVAGNVTFTVSNAPASRAYAFTVEITHTSGTITWFSGVVWPGNAAPVLTTGRVHLFTFVTDNGGTTWRAVANVNYTS